MGKKLLFRSLSNFLLSLIPVSVQISHGIQRYLKLIDCLSHLSHKENLLRGYSCPFPTQKQRKTTHIAFNLFPWVGKEGNSC